MRHNAWGPPSATRGASTASGSSTRWRRQNVRQQVAAHQDYPDPHVYIVRYAEANERIYLVQALSDDQLLQVPKSYAPAEPFPIASSQHAPGARLLRWAVYALLGVGLGGFGGVLLGVPVVLAAGVQLTQFARRVRRWRRDRQGADRIPALPAAASAERLRLLSAFGQGLLAIVLGGLLLGLLAWHLV